MHRPPTRIRPALAAGGILTAADPSFLDARDGILAADVDRNHGDNTDLIWTVFAKRGAGASAASAVPPLQSA